MMGFTKMRSGIFASIGAHLLVVLFAHFGLPQLFTQPPVSVTIIPVDLVTLDSLNAPPPPATPEPEPEPEAAAPPPPPPPPKAPPEPEVVEAPPPPPVVKPKPPKKEPPKEPEKAKPKPSPLAQAKPRTKPKPPKPLRDFASILKDLPTEKTPPKTQKPAAPKNEGKPAPSQSQINDLASITETERFKQMMRQQIKPCWSPPVGAAGAEDLAITIFIRIDQRGFVSEARVINAEAMSGNTYAQAAADAARRAVLNPQCQPFQLPQNRYDAWKEINFNFDPREMLG
jgi:outer membrane biosynthesis protein TonB